MSRRNFAYDIAHDGVCFIPTRNSQQPVRTNHACGHVCQRQISSVVNVEVESSLGQTRNRTRVVANKSTFGAPTIPSRHETI